MISKPSRSQAFSWRITNGGEAILQNHGGQNHEVGTHRDESTNVGAGHHRNSLTASRSPELAGALWPASGHSPANAAASGFRL